MLTLTQPEPSSVSSSKTTLTLHRTQGEIFRHPSRFKVVVTGRRWGKSRLEVAEVVRDISKGGRFWYVAPTYDQARDIAWPEFRRFIPQPWLRRTPNETRLELEGHGWIIQLKSADNPDSLRGRGNRKVVLDEYQDMDPVVLTEVILPSLVDTAGDLMIAGTPKSFNHLYDAFQHGQSTDPKFRDWASWQFKTLDAAAPVGHAQGPTFCHCGTVHGHIDPAEVELMRGVLDARTFRQEFEASFEALAGRAYYAFSRQYNVAPVTLETAAPVCCFFDFNIEPATAGIGQARGEHAVVWREVKLKHRGGEATLSCARRVREILNEAHFTGPIRIYGDATGKAPKSTGPADHAILRDVFPGATWCIPRGNPHEKDRVAAVNAMCETMTGAHRLVVDPACSGLIADLEQVIFAENGELDKKSNPELTHLSDGLGYWIARDYPVPEPKSRVGMERIEEFL